MRNRVPGKDVEDQGRPVDDLAIESLVVSYAPLDVPNLGRRQLVVEHRDFRLSGFHQFKKFFQLSLPDVGARIRMIEILRHRSNNIDLSRLAQERQLFERRILGPAITLVIDTNKDRALGG